MNGRRAVATLVVVLCLMAELGGGGITRAVGAEIAASGPDPAKAALAHVAAQRDVYGLSADDLDELVVSDVVPALRDASVVYVQQRHRGLDLYNSISSVAVEADGTVLSVASRFVGGVAKAAPAPTPSLSDVAAVRAAADALGLVPTEAFSAVGSAAGAERARSVSDGGISLESIPVRLVYRPQDDGSVDLAWDVQISTLDRQNIWQIRVDARTGAELDRNNLVAHEADPVGGGSYNVYPEPIEAPSFGGRALKTDPADAAASPFGWHDTDGVAGAEDTRTLGNNVTAYTDTDNNNAPDAGSQPDGGAGLAFDFPIDLTQAPSTYRPAAVTNLFYWNNYIHDVFYAYGFDEASGNFQANNYGNGGAGNDAVQAEAQDGGGVNNANFATPADGGAPRMQMYNWTTTTPGRDGDLDNGIIIHEYGHGISNRLTGGPAAAGCLSNQEQGGEGWSDWFALMLTMDASDVGTDGRGIGTYALGQPPTGVGIRAFPYSTNMTTDPRTYDTIKTATVPHGVGSVWAAMLWELTWTMIGSHGFDPDLIGGSGGNNMALRLVTDGLKLQPCSPGFVDARNAILLADQANYSGIHVCALWDAFAKRGLGYSATQGSSASRSDGTQAFDIPGSCKPLELTKTASPNPVAAGGVLTFSLTATSHSGSPLTGVQILDPVPSNTTFVPDSATCGGVLVPGGVQMDVGTLDPGDSQTCSFEVIVDSSPVPSVLLSDGFDAGSGNWAMTHTAGTVDFALSTANPHSPPNSMFATDPASVSDQRVATIGPLAISATDDLQFQHSRVLEAAAGTVGFDGGVVEASTDGGSTWVDIGVNAVQNGYTHTISSSYGNPLAGRAAFSGASPGYIQSIIDLSSLAGSSALIRFRLGSDSSVSAAGWHIDDVEVGSNLDLVVANTAGVSSDQLYADEATTETAIIAPLVPGAPTISSAVRGDQEATVSWTAPTSDGGAPVTGYQVTPYISGVAQAPVVFAGDPATTQTLTGLTNGAAYRFTVAAINVAGTGPESAESKLVRPATLPGAPTIGSVTRGNGSATVSWSAPGSDGGTSITKYLVTPHIGGVAQPSVVFGAGATVRVVTGLANGTEYTFTVAARNAVGTGPDSSPSGPATPATVPGAPTIGVATAGDGEATVSWTAPASNGGSPVTGYVVTPYLAGVAQSPVVFAGDTATMQTLSGLVNGSRYAFRVAAINDIGTGVRSLTSNRVTPSAPI